jgi:hypothetical protein
MSVEINVDAKDLERLVAKIVRTTFAEMEERIAATGSGSRMAYGEPEAAALIGLQPHQLRDERRRGRIQASVGPRNRIMYTPQNLKDYLARRRWKGDALDPNAEKTEE